MRALTLALGLLAANVVAVPTGQISGASAMPAQQTVTSRFLDSPVEPLRQFSAVRHLEARNQRFKKHGWVDVRTELSPEDGFSFEIQVEGGSSYIRKNVLLPILEGERANRTYSHRRPIGADHDLPVRNGERTGRRLFRHDQRAVTTEAL